MNYAKIDFCDISNGKNIGIVLWIQGCTLNCPGCHNQETWDFNGGKLVDDECKNMIFNQLKKSYISRFTISGGHPLEYKNLQDVYDLIKEIKMQFPEKDVWLYTGYTLSINDFDITVDICFDNRLLKNYIITMCDVVVDGPYIEEQRDITLAFRGSRNQRLIDVKETIKQNKIVTIQN